MSRLAELHKRLVRSGPKTAGETLLFFMLVPVSILYGGVSWIRNICYDCGLLPVYRGRIPVVSIGNLAAGGTGKTPAVDWLVKQFAERGKNAAILSRGYGGSLTAAAGIVARGDGRLELDAETAGDEPCLLAKRNPDNPVVVARKRKNGIRLIEKSFGVDVIVLDDGFQHRAVARDFDLVLLDDAAPLGNGFPLPAGNLREFPRGLKRADYLLLTRSVATGKAAFCGIPAVRARYQLAENALTLSGEFKSLTELSSLKLVAFAGIAHPESFFSALESVSQLSIVGKVDLPDHAQYDQNLMRRIHEAGRNADAFITTEKDAVKLAPEMFERPCYQVPLVLDMKQENDLVDLIFSRIWR